MPLRQRCDLKFVVITTALLLSLMLIPGWQCSYPVDQGDHWNHENPWVDILYATPSTVIVPETGSANVTLDFTSNRYNSTSGHWYQTDDPNWPDGLTMPPVDAQPDVSGRFRTRFVVESRRVVPGLYRVPVKLRWSEKIIIETTTLTVIVFPSPGQSTPPAVRIAAGANHTLAILADGSVWSWGANTYGQLGDGTTSDRLAPVQVQGLPGPAQAIAAGEGHSLVLLNDGTVWGWGDDRKNQLSPEVVKDTDPITPIIPTPIPVYCTAERYYVQVGNVWQPGPLRDIVDVAAGSTHSMALTSDGAVITFGFNLYGQLGRPGAQSPRLANEVELGFRITAIAAGDEFSLALDEDGWIWGWGSNSAGQLGDHSQSQFDSPREIPFMMNIQAIAAGGDHTLALKTDGTVRAVGSNRYGQLGDETYSGPTATTVYGLPPITAIAAGYAHSLALGNDGRVYGFGDNGAGQIGIPDTLSHSAPSVVAPIRDLQDVRAIAAGNQHSLCLVSGCPTILSWGDNRVGQLGDGTVQPSAEPVQVDGIGQAGNSPPCQVSLSVMVVGDGIVTSDPWGIECGDNCSELFAPDTLVTLTAVPVKGCNFEGWYGDVQGTDQTMVVQMDRSKNCLALFTREPLPPTARFTISPQLPLTTDTIIFDAKDSTDDGEIIRYEWDFNNDGTFELRRNRTETNASFIASFVDDGWQVGSYTVLLRVTDDDGLTDTTSRDLQVADAEPPRHDLGDAPDSSNSLPGIQIFAYPMTGVVANYPTTHRTSSAPYGPLHMEPEAYIYLGQDVTLENEADVGVDEDPNNNFDSALERADQDGGDDGVQFPITLPYCEQTSFDYVVTVVEPPHQYIYVNVWFDWNRDGDWDDTLTCPDGSTAREWAVRNQEHYLFETGTMNQTTPSFMCWHPSESNVSDPIWMRITLSEEPWQSDSSGAGGSGPQNGYKLGETEDYLVFP